MSKFVMAWATADELEYIRNAGTYVTWDVTMSELAARELALTRYVEAAERRQCWGDLDGAACRIFAERELRKVKSLRGRYESAA